MAKLHARDVCINLKSACVLSRAPATAMVCRAVPAPAGTTVRAMTRPSLSRHAAPVGPNASAAGGMCPVDQQGKPRWRGADPPFISRPHEGELPPMDSTPGLMHWLLAALPIVALIVLMVAMR